MHCCTRSVCWSPLTRIRKGCYTCKQCVMSCNTCFGYEDTGNLPKVTMVSGIWKLLSVCVCVFGCTAAQMRSNQPLELVAHLTAHVDMCLHEDVLGQRVVASLSLGHGKHASSREGCLNCHSMLLAPALVAQHQSCQHTMHGTPCRETGKELAGGHHSSSL